LGEAAGAEGLARPAAELAAGGEVWGGVVALVRGGGGGGGGGEAFQHSSVTSSFATATGE